MISTSREHMGRKRKSGDHLPKYVYPHRGWYIYRPYLGHGRLGTPINLVPTDRPVSEVWAAWEDLRRQDGDTVGKLMRTYIRENTRLATRTKTDYEAYSKTLATTKLKDGRHFGDLRPSTIKRVTIRRYLDKNAATPTAANRRIQFLKAAYAWALERGRVPENPCVGVRLHPTPARDRYVTDAEYTAVLNLARSKEFAKRYPYIWIMMELAYLCRARRSEVCAMRRQDADMRAMRLEWSRGKGSRAEVTVITTRLAATITAAKALEAKIASPYMVHRHGQPIKKNAFDSAWRRLMDAAMPRDEDGQLTADAIIQERFTFHDLKAKGVSDHKDHYSGHRSEKQRADYIRKPDEVEATR